MNLGENIKQFRKMGRLTQSDLAKEIGIPRATLQKYESGSIQNVPLPIITAIGEALEVSPCDLVGWSSSQSDVAEVIDAYHMLDEESKLLIMKLMDRLK